MTEPSIPTRLVGAFTVILQRLSDRRINWAVTGSLGFRLQKLPVTVNDIDLQADAAGAYRMEELLREYSTRKVRDSSTGQVRSHFGALVKHLRRWGLR